MSQIIRDIIASAEQIFEVKKDVDRVIKELTAVETELTRLRKIESAANTVVFNYLNGIEYSYYGIEDLKAALEQK